MKCPYNNFKDCLVEKCPSCNYEEIKEKRIEGICPAYMSTERALEMGYSWYETKTSYKFLSCNLAQNNVQPVPSSKTVINNDIKMETDVLIRKSIF